MTSVRCNSKNDLRCFVSSDFKPSYVMVQEREVSLIHNQTCLITFDDGFVELLTRRQRRPFTFWPEACEHSWFLSVSIPGTLPSLLPFLQVIKREGTGTETPMIGDRVFVHYTGWLLDGTKFETPAWTARTGSPSTWGKVGMVSRLSGPGCVCCHKQTYSQKLKHGTVYYSSFLFPLS